MEDIILQTHGISVKYGNFLALDDVNISLKHKHIYGFIGENGAGKTTLMREASCHRRRRNPPAPPARARTGRRIAFFMVIRSSRWKDIFPQ